MADAFTALLLLSSANALFDQLQEMDDDDDDLMIAMELSKHRNPSIKRSTRISGFVEQTCSIHWMNSRVTSELLATRLRLFYFPSISGRNYGIPSCDGLIHDL